MSDVMVLRCTSRHRSDLPEGVHFPSCWREATVLELVAALELAGWPTHCPNGHASNCPEYVPSLGELLGVGDE